MSQQPDDDRPPLALDEVARVARELAAEADVSTLLARFREAVCAWAAPSALLAARREEDDGWRVLPAVTMGSLPIGFERSLARLVQEAPACLVRPTVFQPRDDLSGVKARDNWVVPWSCDGQSGVLFLRGVPRPSAPNLGDAIALVSAPVWPRVLGSPAVRIEALLDTLRQVSGQLQAETGRQLERLQAARPVEPLPTAEPLEGDRIAELEQQLSAAQDEAQRRSQEAEALRAEAAAAAERVASASRSVEEEQRSAEQSRAAVEQATARAEQAEAAARAAEARAQAAENKAQSVEARLEAAEDRAQAAEGRAELAEAKARAAAAVAEEADEKAQAAEAKAQTAEQAHEKERAAASERYEERRRAAESAEARARMTEQALAAAQQAFASHADSLRAERTALAERCEEQTRAVDAAEARARAAEEAVAAARREVADARQREEQSQARVRDLATRWDTSLEIVRAALVTLRRTAFVPPGLRFAMDEVAARLQPDAPRSTSGLRVVILDRDLGGLEPLAAELEAAGAEVKIANYPEELGLLLRTPGGRELGAAICDVMAFRPDQNVAALFRSWDQDRPGLAFFLSFDAESPVEVERARRVPPSFFVGQLPRPLDSRRVAEALEALTRRHAKS